jgi:ELWxxDGT repeat protein
MLRNCFYLVMLLLIYRAAAAQTPTPPYLVKNINQLPYYDNVRLIDVSGTLYFTKTSPTGIELWRSDSTPTGAVFIKKLYTDPFYDYALHFLAVGSTLYFNVLEYPGGGLWKTDGTPEGTSQVKELSSIQYLTLVNGTVYFGAALGSTGQELWKSDGTTAGTMLVKDIVPGGNGSVPKNLVDVNGTLYFSADNGTLGRELWKSNGTEAGTVLVKDIYAGAPGSIDDFTSFCVSNNKLFLLASTNTPGRGIWKSDGTEAGTILVKHFTYGIDGQIVDLNGIVLFAAQDDVPTGVELWKTDGSTGGTVLVKDIAHSNSTSSYPTNLTKAGGNVFFSVLNDQEVSSGESLWRSDGTAAGTSRVTELRRAEIATSYHREQVGSAAGKLYFSNYDDAYGDELWQTDGTTTSLVTDLRPGPEGAAPRKMTEANGQAYFVAFPNDGFQRIYRTNGTTVGTQLAISDAFYTSDAGSTNGTEDPTNFTGNNLTDLGNGILAFTARTSNGYGLFRTDGTAAGTVELKNFGPYVHTSPRRFVYANGTLYFAATDNSQGEELWKSDGTAAGTVLVSDINPGFAGSSPSELTAVNGTVYFRATHSAYGRELWKSDGTAAGTVLVKDIYPGTSFSEYTVPQHLTALNGMLYFTVSDGTYGRELWKSDGTAAGTVLVKDIRTGAQPSMFSSSYMVTANGLLYFTAYEDATGYELWKSDGSTAGTVLVKDIYPGAGEGLASYPGFVISNGLLYFTANDGTYGEELWKTDGTTAGTTMVADLRPGAYGSGPLYPVDLNGTLFFSAYDEASGGYRLWKTNGQAANTSVVRSDLPGSATMVNYVTAASGKIYFGVSTGSYPITFRLWQSDGTAAGTLPVAENIQLKNTVWSVGSDGTLNNTYHQKILVPTQNRLYFFGDDTIYGMELWAIDLAPCSIMQSLKSGSWHDAAVWSCGRLPLASDDITIATGHSITLESAGTARSLALQGVLQFLAGGGLTLPAN